MKNIIENIVDLNFPISVVWQAITDHNEFGEWFKVKLQQPFVPNKTTYGRINHPGYEHIAWEVLVQEIIPEQLFSFSWHPYPVDSKKDYSQEISTLVEFKLQKTPAGTSLTIVESGFDKLPKERQQEAFDTNSKGWLMQVVNIKNYLGGGSKFDNELYGGL